MYLVTDYLEPFDFALSKLSRRALFGWCWYIGPKKVGVADLIYMFVYIASDLIIPYRSYTRLKGKGKIFIGKTNIRLKNIY